MNYFLVFLTALFTSTILVSVMMRLAPVLGLVDHPDARKVHAEAIPRVGGIGIVVGSIVAMALWLQPDRETWLLQAGMAVIALFALLDDRWDLDYRAKFGGQLIAALIVVVPKAVLIDHVSFVSAADLPFAVSAPLTVLFLMGMTNATNLSDGLDGLAAGLSIISLIGLIILASLSGNDSNFIPVAVIVIGATLGFLRYNAHPAMVFMGDSGSQFLGFSLGVLAVLLSQHENTAIAPELPLFVLGLPIVDTLRVMAERILAGKSPFRPDKNHFHHKLLNLGLDHYQAVLAIYGLQATYLACAYFLRYESVYVVLGIYLFIAAVIVSVHPLGTRLELKFQMVPPKGLSNFSRRLLRTSHVFIRANSVVLCGLIGIYIFGATAIPADLAHEVFPLCAAVVAITLICRIGGLAVARAMLRLSLYSCALLSCYATFKGTNTWQSLHPDWHSAMFVALIVSLACSVRFARANSFRLTPSDYLMVAGLVLAGNMPDLKDPRLSQLVIESAVVLYGTEFVVHGRKLSMDMLLAVSTVSVVLIGLQAGAVA